MARLCYWCHEPLDALPEDASYVDEINHYIHEGCRRARDRYNRQMEKLRTGIKDGSIDSIPDVVRAATLQRIESLGFSERCKCLYDPDFGFKGYDLLLDDEERDLDEQNSVTDCALCGGTGTHDRLPELVSLIDDKKAEVWVAEQFRKSSGPCDHWPGFPEEGWYCDSLGYNRTGKDAGRGITLYNIDFMKGGIITWLEIADVFRPRVQSVLF